MTQALWYCRSVRPPSGAVSPPWPSPTWRRGRPPTASSQAPKPAYCASTPPGTLHTSEMWLVRFLSFCVAELSPFCRRGLRVIFCFFFFNLLLFTVHFSNFYLFGYGSTTLFLQNILKGKVPVPVHILIAVFNCSRLSAQSHHCDLLQSRFSQAKVHKVAIHLCPTQRN